MIKMNKKIICLILTSMFFLTTISIAPVKATDAPYDFLDQVCDTGNSEKTLKGLVDIEYQTLKPTTCYITKIAVKLSREDTDEDGIVTLGVGMSEDYTTEKSVSYNSIPTNPGWVTFEFDEPFAIISLANIFIALLKLDGGELYWHGDDSNPYDRGQCMSDSDFDFNFKSYGYNLLLLQVMYRGNYKGGTISIDGYEYDVDVNSHVHIKCGTHMISANMVSPHFFDRWHTLVPDSKLVFEDEYSSTTTFTLYPSITFLGDANIALYCLNQAPNKPVVDGPSSLNRKEESTFSACSDDVNGNQLWYLWEWGDGTTSGTFLDAGPAGQTVYETHKYNEPGTYQVIVTAKENWAGNDLDSPPSDPFAVEVINLPPNTPQKPSGPYEGAKGVSYSFKTKTSEPENDRVKFGWDWDGDGVVEDGDWTREFILPNTFKSMDHTFNEPGSYTIKVVAEDEYGAQSDFSSGLTINIRDNDPPNKPEITGDSSGRPKVTYSFTASTTDPDGDSVVYLFDFGDGSDSDWGGSTVEHQWDSPGSYEIKVKAKDSLGVSGPWSDPHTIELVNNAPTQPTKPDGSTEVNRKTKYSYTTKSTDSDGDAIYYRFDWDDGSSMEWLGPYESGEECTTEHEWTKKGSYDIKVQSRDDYGGKSEWSEILSISVSRSREKEFTLHIYHFIQKLFKQFFALRLLLD
jgi:hypothetical protein